MSWQGRSVLVTGAGGFIGSHLVERLAREGARVRALLRYPARGGRRWLEQANLSDVVEIVLGDVQDAESVADAMRGVDTVFHLAALIAIPYSYAAPLSYLRTNAEGTLNVLQAARRHKLRMLVHTSTSEVYGSARVVPIDESHPLQGQSPYAASKIAADKMVEAFHKSFGVPCVTLRPFNTYGPRQTARAIVPAIVTQALAGDDVRVGNLDPTRDLNFVDDVVEAFVLAAAGEPAIGETIHIGSGREISVRDLIALVGRLLGRTLQIRVDPARVRPASSEVDRLKADNGKARRLLGWAPKVKLEEGLTRTIRWIEQHADHFNVREYAI